VAVLGPDERVARTRIQPGRGVAQGGLAAVGTNFGTVAVAAPLQAGASPDGEGVEVLQGRATRPLASRTSLAGASSPFSLARAYLGDVAIATVLPGRAIAVSVQRYFRPGFADPRLIPIGPGRLTALTATMDYRSDVLVTWEQNGSIYAHMLRASRRPERTQRVGASFPSPQLQALVSDNDHGMIAWSSSDPRARGARTSVRLALSSAGVRFLAGRVVASYADPAGLGSSPGSLALVRLSTENVMLAWTDAERGHHVVRAAPAVFAGVRPSARLSDPAGQSVLADLAAGPAGEVVALWRAATAPGAGADWTRTELWAARAVIMRHGIVGSRRPERVAGPARNASPSVAVDPANDRPVAAWLTLGRRPRLHYASGPVASGYRPGTAALRPKGAGTHWLRISVAAAGAVAIAALIALAARTRARARRGAGARAGRGRPR
jgi:hypothetical protein